MKRAVAFGLVLCAACMFASPGDASQPRAVLRPRETRGAELAGGWRLWVHVVALPRGVTAAAADCTDGDQMQFSRFSKAKTSGLSFNYSARFAPSAIASQVVPTIQSALNTWDDVVPANYFHLNATGGAGFPRQDGNNSIGWTIMFPRNTLATTYSWEGPDGRIAESDVFFNRLNAFGIYTICNAASTVELGDIITHELGHTLGLDHVSDPGRKATLFPSAPAGEVLKRTLTTGDRNGFLDALA